MIYHGGISFIILRFTTHGETYLIDGQEMIDAYEDIHLKSFSYKKVKEVGILIQESYIPRLKYLDAVDIMYFSEVKHEEKRTECEK